MTAEQYWDGDCTLVRAYRKAEELRADKQNLYLWLQGRYIYDALTRVAPVLHAFAKKGTKPGPYMEEPYPLTPQAAKQAEETAEVKQYNKNKKWVESFQIRNNLAFKQ